MTTLTQGPVCPIPIDRYPVITMAHGGGGRMMNDLIGQMFVAALDNPALAARHDAADVKVPGTRLAVTTDSFVVKPLFFPGGDIGTLAVNGTVNDVAMTGARPLYLTLGLILEEGLKMETLWRVVQSIKSAAELAGVVVVTGDTKVVENGKGDGVYINTAGIGEIHHDLDISPASVRAGDVVLLSGDIGRHGIVIMAERDGLEFETDIVSDCAPLADTVQALLDAGVEIHCLRDLTRGGLAAAAHEIASTSGTSFVLDETAIPVHEAVRGVCELLGLDPIHVANEGRFVCVLPGHDAERALTILRARPETEGATIAGAVREGRGAPVLMTSHVGTERIVDLPSGEQLPRIC